MDSMFGAGLWSAMRRLGILQNGELRVCKHAAESLHNAATNVYDKLRCQSADFPARVADVFARYDRTWSLVIGCEAAGTTSLIVVSESHSTQTFYLEGETAKKSET